MSKYSIILPVKNGGAFIKECVTSILSQSLADFNLHILENQSTDGTAEWLQTLTDSRVILLPSEKPLTIAENWHRILTIKKNEFTTLIGHDDVLLPHYLVEMDKLIARHPKATLYQSHFHFIDANGQLLRSCLPMDETQQSYELLAALTTKKMDSMGTGYMFRSKDYDALGGISPLYPDLLFADNELWVNLTSIGYKATTFTNCFSYRLHQSLSRTTGGMDYYQSFSQYILFLKRKIKEDENMREVIVRYGKSMLVDNCEAVSHRLLKTSAEKRTVTVKQFLLECRQYAAWLIPGQHFEPTQNTMIAERIDSNKVAGNVFRAFRKFYKGKI